LYGVPLKKAECRSGSKKGKKALRDRHKTGKTKLGIIKDRCGLASEEKKLAGALGEIEAVVMPGRTGELGRRSKKDSSLCNR